MAGLSSLSPQGWTTDDDFGRTAVLNRANRGIRTVMFGDSMSAQLEQDQVPLASLNYNKATGVLTIGYTSHQQATGWKTTFWDTRYPSIRDAQLYEVTRVDADTLQINIGANLPDVPDGVLATGFSFMRPQNLIGAEHWMSWLQYLSGNRFDVVYNGAQSGNTTEDCLRRLIPACLAWDPQVVFMQMPGINDAGIVDEETINNNRYRIIDAIAPRVQYLIILTTTPVASGEVRATTRIMSRTIRMNNRLKEYVRGKPNVILFDAYGLIVDPINTTGLAQANVLRTTDNIHYSMRGGKLIADALWAQIQPLFPTNLTNLPESVLDCYASSAVSLTSVVRTNNVIQATASNHGFITGEYGKIFSAAGASEALNEWGTITRVDANTIRFPSVGPDGAITGTITLGTNNNLMPNPLLTGTTISRGGGITAGQDLFAPNLNAFRSGNPTVDQCDTITVAGIPGRVQRFRMQATAANDRLSVVTLIPDIARHLKAGRRYRISARLSLTGVAGSNLSEIRFNLAFTLDGVIYQTYALAGYSSGATLNTDTGTLFLLTPWLLCPPFTSATEARMDCTIRASAAGTPVTGFLSEIKFEEFEGL